MTDGRIRPARAADAEAVQRVARRAWHAAYDELLGAATVDERVDAWYAPEAVRRDVARDDRPFLVRVDSSDGVVGFAVGTPDEEIDHRAHLYRLYVDPDHWGAGVGTALCDRLATRLRDRGATELAVSVLADNERATRFYETWGFERVERTHDGDHERLVYRTSL